MDPNVELPLKPGAGHTDNVTELHKKVAGSLGVTAEEVRPITADSDIIETQTGEQFDQMINPTDIPVKAGGVESVPVDKNPTGFTKTALQAGELAQTVFSGTAPVRTTSDREGNYFAEERKAKQEGK